MKVLLIGATGNTGALCLKLLCHHPHVSQISAVSSSAIGLPINDITLTSSNKLLPDHYISIDEIESQYDVIFSTLPHGVTASVYQKIMEKMSTCTIEHASSKASSSCTNTSSTHPLNVGTGTSKSLPVFIDVSADFRFPNIHSYEQAYGEASKEYHSVAHARALHKAVYGLSELQRAKIQSADIIACPGCYPTSILLPLIPVLRYCTPIHTITISSISGISGAGAHPKENNMFIHRSESLTPYNPGRTHRHFFEIAQSLQDIAYSNAACTFSPMLAPLTQGILSTIHIPLESYDVSRAEDALRAQYIDEYFVSVFPSDNPIDIDTKRVRNTNHVHIGVHKEDNMLILFCAIDNLWKGAVGQAIQNCNIRFDIQEHVGLEYISI